MTRLIDADVLLEKVKTWCMADAVINAITNAPTIQQSEPFGYFKAEPFGWTDCAETDEGAIALYEAPTIQSEGWVSVPIEPTEEMIDAARWEDGKQTAINVYKLMVAAAPTDTE